MPAQEDVVVPERPVPEATPSRAEFLRYPWSLLLTAYVTGLATFLAWIAMGRADLEMGPLIGPGHGPARPVALQRGEAVGAFEAGFPSVEEPPGCRADELWPVASSGLVAGGPA